MVIVRPAGGRSIASPVSSGGASYGPPVGPYGPAGRPGREARRHRRPAPQEVDQLVARRRREVEGRGVHAVLRGRDDARLVRAGERVRPPPGGRRGRRRRRPVSAPTSSAADRRQARRARSPRRRPRPRRGRRGARRGAAPARCRSGGLAARSPGAGDRRREPGQRLAHRVDRRGERLDLGRRELVVEREAGLERALRREQRVELVEPLARASSPGRGPRPAPTSSQHLERDPRAVDVGLEVPQVRVRPDLLLAGDLAGRDLVEQLLRAVRDLERLEREVGGVDLVDQLLRVRRRGPSPRRRAGPASAACRRCRRWRRPSAARGPSRCSASRSTRRPRRGRPRARRAADPGRRTTRRPARCAPSGRGPAAYRLRAVASSPLA